MSSRRAPFGQMRALDGDRGRLAVLSRNSQMSRKTTSTGIRERQFAGSQPMEFAMLRKCLFVVLAAFWIAIAEAPAQTRDQFVPVLQQ